MSGNGTDNPGDGHGTANGNGTDTGGCFQTLDVTHFRKALTRLHELVGNSKGRIEIKRRGCDDVCVLISKTELESLEQALEILAGTAMFQQMCDEITRLAATAGPPPCSQAMPS